MLEKENKRLKENEIENERGRSMVEMLGVLAIMGVLAIGGIAGYRYAMDKYNANEILNEVRKRAVTASQQRLLGHSINLSEYGVNTVQGYAIETADNYNGNATQFTITVKGINQGVCNQVIDSPLPMVIEELVGGVVVADDVDCTAETNDVLFAFANDLASGSVGGGDGGEGNPPEEFDPTAPENNVICNNRGECLRCDDYPSHSEKYLSNLEDKMCEVCSNRVNVVAGPYNQPYCIPKECENGFRSEFGFCHPCDTPEGVYVGSGGTCEEDCQGSGYERVQNGSYCNLKSVCENGFQSSGGGCYPCDTPEGIDVGRSGLCEEACQGSGYERVKNGDYCNLKSICDNGFQDSSGRCYSCDTPGGIYVGGSGPCEEACRGSGYERVKNGDYCNLKSVCENGFQDSSGGCYPCDIPSTIDVGSNGTCSEACIGADKRFKRCNTWERNCYCNLCPKNVASIALNTQEMCEACGGQWNGSVCCDGDRCATAITP